MEPIDLEDGEIEGEILSLPENTLEEEVGAYFHGDVQLTLHACDC
jgi:hypothetical protein